MRYLKTYENLNYAKARSIIKNYIKKSSTSIVKRFFIILYNYLLLSEMFPDIFSKYHPNKLTDYLELKETDDIVEIDQIFNKMYDPNSIIRNNLEKVSDIVELRHITDDDFYNKILYKNDISIKDKIYKYNL